MKYWEYTINSIWLINLLVLVGGLYYAIPERYILDYRSINVEFECVEDSQVLHAQSERYPKITVTGSGEDNIYLYPIATGLPEKRIEWSGATYRAGTERDAWDILIEGAPLQPGRYVLVGEVQIKFLFLIRALDPIQSNVFNVTTCEKNP